MKLKTILLTALAAVLLCSCSDENKNLLDYDKDYDFTAELTTQATDVIPNTSIAFSVVIKDAGPKVNTIKMSCITSGCGSISCNGVTLQEQSGFVDVKNGDVVNFMPSSPSGSFILTFSNEKTTDRYEVVMREIEKTGKGYISWMHSLYEGI